MRIQTTNDIFVCIFDRYLRGWHCLKHNNINMLGFVCLDFPHLRHRSNPFRENENRKNILTAVLFRLIIWF